MAGEQYGSLNHYINGQWIEAEKRATFRAFSPSDGGVIAMLAEGTRRDAQDAVAAARVAKDVLAGMTIWERAKLCQRIGDALENRRDELIEVLSADQGKPQHSDMEARGEVGAAISGFYHAAEQIKWLESSFIPVEDPNKRVYTYRRPRGVYAVVTPWNFPINIPVEYIAPGLAAGNAIVWVPAPSTSVCAVKLMECIAEADAPPGAVNLVTGEGAVVGDEIVAHPDVQGVGFTGSSATGAQIARRSAGKAQLLEMGGNGPTLVLQDADLDRAARAVAFGCFWNAGQVCTATEKILVHEAVQEEFVDRLVREASKVRLGPSDGANTTMGPLNNEATAKKMDEHLADGLARGAEVRFGGARAPELGSSLFYQPTVVDNVDRDSLLSRHETFGPVAPVIAYNDLDEELAAIKASGYGLGASIFTQRIDKAIRLAERMDSGLVNINEHSGYWEPHIPFGGAAGTCSGIGRLGGRHGIMAMSDLRTVTINLS